MPEISLFQPTALQKVVSKMTAPEELMLLNRLPRTPWPFPSVNWEIIQGSRNIATPNVPNSEAHIVPQLGRGQGNASFVYLREKKTFSPTALHWIKEIGTMAKTNAEATVLREVGDLNTRFDNYFEWLCWQALTGNIEIDTKTVKASIDYKFAASHKATVGTSWATATPQQIVADVRSWKRLISRDGRVKPTEVFLTEQTMGLVFDAFTRSAETAALISDRMKEEYYKTGVMSGFMGLSWVVNESIFEDDAGVQTPFVKENSLVMANLTDNRPMEIYQGPTADDSAPKGLTGRFAKTWKEEDPSARQYLLEDHGLPVISRPEQIVYVANLVPA